MTSPKERAPQTLGCAPSSESTRQPLQVGFQLWSLVKRFPTSLPNQSAGAVLEVGPFASEQPGDIFGWMISGRCWLN